MTSPNTTDSRPSTITGDTTGDNAGRRLQLPISGMSCASCVRRVEQALLKVPGVRQASVNLNSEKAELMLADDASLGAVTEAVQQAGYQTRSEQFELSIIGMSCASCVGRVEKALQQLPGVWSPASTWRRKPHGSRRWPATWTNSS
ncbi:heavy-metal-associated domain-containing protein [Oceanisphaera psychrotolerans]|uniref:heavy-metal-associated domain-containing protein n=1 Tax=Oceanisphaera psychrotolerans TaxID=1414654 RepID=UPI000A50E157|nr:heavy metal-associated domain-containing protein [Oceanisphaera psychrotolerans]